MIQGKTNERQTGSFFGHGICLLSILCCSACSLLPIDTISPTERANSSIGETFVRIHMYMKEHREAPPNLTVLPKRDGYANDIMDGWGHGLHYEVDKNGVITLSSLGADGKPGGGGQNKDIIRQYRTRNSDGSLIIDDELWIVHAEIRNDTSNK